MKKVLSLAVLLCLTSPAFAGMLTEADVVKNIAISKNPMPLNSRLNKRYEAYKITLTNNYGSDLRLASGNIDNSLTGKVAADSSALSPFHVLWGLPLGIVGIGIASCVVYTKNHKAEVEGFSYPGQVPNAVIGKGESVTFNTLVPIGQTPNVKVTLATVE